LSSFQQPERRVDRLIRRFPEPVRPDLQESAQRLLAIRSPKDAVGAMQDEVEHLLRVSIPLFVRYPAVRGRRSAKALVASAAGIAAAAEEGEELLALLSLGTLAAPGLGTVLALNLLASATEAYAATSVRVSQLRAHGRPVIAERVAAEIRQAMLGTIEPSSATPALIRRVAKSGAARLGTRWVIAAIPVFGIVYGGFDASRTVDRVLELTLPPLDATSEHPAPPTTA
jgi:hypothetical protein